MVNIAKHTTHVMTGKAIGPAAGCLHATTQMDHEATKIKKPAALCQRHECMDLLFFGGKMMVIQWKAIGNPLECWDD